MCGFAGIVNLKGLNIDSDLKTKMGKAIVSLQKRGPDKNGEWISKNCYFIHTRLRVIDISSSSDQPMTKNGYVLCYNGEIYNYKEIRSELVKLGYRFKSNGDAEVLLAGWIEWGDQLIKKLSGMFSFVIWNDRKKILYLGRDQFGKKPLVYSLGNNYLAFASDVRSLSKIVNCGPVDRSAVESLFRFRYIHEPLTIFSNAKKLGAGVLASYSSRGFFLNKWYQLKNYDFFSQISYKEAKKRLIQLFDNSLQKRLSSDVPIGLFLSSGLDSGIILSGLSKIGKRLPCFTLGYENSSSYYEERKNASKLSKYFGMDHYSINVTPKDTLKLVPEILMANDEPFADTIHNIS